MEGFTVTRVEYDVDEDGRITEIPPVVLTCGHRYGPRLVIVGYEWSEQHQRRVRTYCCRTCQAVTEWP